MPSQKQVVEALFMEGEEEEDASKIRKRGCSPSSASSSSILHNYHFKKAVLVGKRGGSTTPVPSWRVISSRSPSISLRMATAAEPPQSQLGRSKAEQNTQPVSARKLAATLWELNEVPVAAPGRRKKVDSSVSGSFAPHLSDPSHSPISERSDRSGTRTQRTHQSSSESRRQSRNAIDVGVLDSISNASFMEQSETTSRHQSQTHSGSAPGFVKNLKDVSNTLNTSKELLKIISRMWGQQDNQPTTSMTLITALHTELERARLQVNQMVKEKREDQSTISCLVKRFAEEKAAWENKERKTINAAIESIAEELEVERKLRRRAERLNKKLENELAETKAYSTTSDRLTDDIQATMKSGRRNEKVYHRASIDNGSLGFSQSEEEGEVEDEVIECNDSVSPTLRRSTLLLRSMSNGADCSQPGRLCEFEKQAQRKSCGDDLQRYKTVKGLRNQILCGSNSISDYAGVDTKNPRRSSSTTTTTTRSMK